MGDKGVKGSVGGVKHGLGVYLVVCGGMRWGYEGWVVERNVPYVVGVMIVVLRMLAF